MKKISVILGCIILYSCSNTDASKVEMAEVKKVELNPNLKPTFPVNDPTVRSQANFNDYAWQMFVALNWPASATERGVADLTKNIGDPGSVVWQSFRTSGSVFLPNAQDPGSWNDGYPMEFKLKQISKVDPAIKEHLKSIGQAVGGPLTDQDSNYTYYEKYMNEVEYNFIHTNKYYDQTVLSSLTTNMKIPTQSMEIKSAWKIMTKNDDQSKFFTAPAVIEGLDGKPFKAVVGLVGLHIIYKSADSPQWVWATFEHINNVPGDPGSTATHFSYNNPNCSAADCPPNVATAPKIPTQVTRYTPLSKEAKASNAKWQLMLKGTVWENYELINMQWPSDPNDPGNPQGTPTPNTMANTTMETYIQRTSSCMGCHSTAGTLTENIKTNYSFLFLEAQSPSKKTK